MEYYYACYKDHVLQRFLSVLTCSFCLREIVLEWDLEVWLKTDYWSAGAMVWWKEGRMVLVLHWSSYIAGVSIAFFAWLMFCQVLSTYNASVSSPECYGLDACNLTPISGKTHSHFWCPLAASRSDVSRWWWSVVLQLHRLVSEGSMSLYYSDKLLLTSSA